MTAARSAVAISATAPWFIVSGDARSDPGTSPAQRDRLAPPATAELPDGRLTIGPTRGHHRPGPHRLERGGDRHRLLLRRRGADRCVHQAATLGDEDRATAST